MADLARETALKVIEQVEKGPGTLQENLARILERNSLRQTDKNFCVELAYGFFRTRIRLEFILRRLLRKPDAIPKAMFIMLALGVYGLLFQTSARDYALLNNTVTWIKKHYGESLAKVGNGVLRQVQRIKKELAGSSWYDVPEKTKFFSQAVFYGIPENIANLWRDAYGEEVALLLMRRSFNRPRMGLRVNALHPEAENLKADLQLTAAPRVTAIGPWGFALESGALPARLYDQETDYWFRSGALAYQAAGSMLILDKLGLFSWNRPVWDVCAGVGGKTAALLEQGIPVTLASDISVRRLTNLKRRFGKIVNIIRSNAKVPPVRKFNGNLLVDAPCSGLGVLARRPDIKKISGNLHERLMLFRREQEQILNGLYQALQPGCELAYLTCTLNPAENEQLIEDFTHRNKDLKLVKSWQTPNEHPWLEGMFGAVVKKC